LVTRSLRSATDDASGLCRTLCSATLGDLKVEKVGQISQARPSPCLDNDLLTSMKVVGNNSRRDLALGSAASSIVWWMFFGSHSCFAQSLRFGASAAALFLDRHARYIICSVASFDPLSLAHRRSLFG
jgi:hypothetical protein